MMIRRSTLMLGSNEDVSDSVGSLLQVVILKYCRGSNTGRANASEQEMKALLTCKGDDRIPENLRDHRLHTGTDHSWRTVSLPDNYYFVFSTLSDSKYASFPHDM